MRPYSLDLRERAVALVRGGRSRRAVARLLGLGESTVIRWTTRQAQIGSCAARPMGGVRHAVLLPMREWLLARIAEAPDLTVRALQGELRDLGHVVSKDAVWRFLRVESLTFKKNAARRRAGAARRRPQARALAASSAPDRSQPPGVC